MRLLFTTLRRYGVISFFLFACFFNQSGSANSQYVPGVGNVVYFFDSRPKLIDKTCANRFINKVIEKIQLKEYSTLSIKVHSNHPLVAEPARFGTLVIYWELKDWEISIFPTWQNQIVVKDTKSGEISVIKFLNMTLDFDQCEIPYATAAN